MLRAKLNTNRCAINPEHCDTAFPSEPHNLSGEKSYYTLRFELSQISSEYVSHGGVASGLTKA